jgi:ketol-acid reductoisomerase
MTVIYYEEDADLRVLEGNTVGVIGYGHLGRPAAFSLRDNGITPLVGGAQSELEEAGGDGFAVNSIKYVVQNSQIILCMLPDEIMTQIYMTEISPHLKRGDTLIFSSAYNVAFGYVEPPPFVDVGLVARRNQINPYEFLSFVAVWQDASRHAWDRVLAVALAIGSLRPGAIEVSIEQEAEISLFVQQAVLPAFYHIITTATNLLIEQGYPPDAVLLDLHLNGMFSGYIQHAARNGLQNTLRQMPLAAQYGTFSRLDRFSELKLERLMEVTLDEIRNGNFAQEWAHEYADGTPRLDKLIRQHETRELWELEQQTLDMLKSDDLQFL